MNALHVLYSLNFPCFQIYPEISIWFRRIFFFFSETYISWSEWIVAISRSIFKFGEQKEKLESDYYRQIEGDSGDKYKFIYHSSSEGGRLKSIYLSNKKKITSELEPMWGIELIVAFAEPNGPGCALVLISWSLNALAYILFLLTLPIAYWVCVHRFTNKLFWSIIFLINCRNSKLEIRLVKQ